MFISNHEPRLLSLGIMKQNLTNLIFYILAFRILFGKPFINFADAHLSTLRPPHARGDQADAFSMSQDRSGDWPDRILNGRRCTFG
jgi:hypothetical protein